jgi:hypothetical protein
MNSATNEYLKFGAEDRKSIYSKYITYSMLISSLILLSAAVYPIIKDLLRNNDQEQIKVEAPRVINYSQLSAPPLLLILRNLNLKLLLLHPRQNKLSSSNRLRKKMKMSLKKNISLQ